jgi:hypothetical protein
MTMPNFLLIGAAKCGTDALCDYLSQHPKVYVSANKEPNFFVAEGQPKIPYRGPRDRDVLTGFDSWISTVEDYRALFDGVTTERAIGEGSTWYIYDESAPGRIRCHVPHARIIAILRNPVDRAYSAFTMMLRDGRETTTDFGRALAMEDGRVQDRWEPLWHYRRMGFYHAQVKRYYDAFGPARVRVVLHDDFVARPRDVMRDIFGFLEVDDGFEPDTTRQLNVSSVPRSLAVQRFVTGRNPIKAIAKAVAPDDLRQRIKEKLVHSTLTKPAPLAPELRQQLAGVFREDVLQLQDLLGRDLSRWLR